MEFRTGQVADLPLLAELNHQLIRNEGHRNAMTVAQLEERMRGWIAGEYRAILFEDGGEVVAYALYREQEEIYLRQFFVIRSRRRQGLGRRAFEILRGTLWPADKRLTVAALTANPQALGFWRTMGFCDYSLTLEIMPCS